MKKLVLLFAVFALVTTIACNKEDEPEEEAKIGSIELSYMEGGSDKSFSIEGEYNYDAISNKSGVSTKAMVGSSDMYINGIHFNSSTNIDQIEMTFNKNIKKGDEIEVVETSLGLLNPKIEWSTGIEKAVEGLYMSFDYELSAGSKINVIEYKEGEYIKCIITGRGKDKNTDAILSVLSGNFKVYF